MSATLAVSADTGRTARLTALVSPSEAHRIAEKAAEAGLSVSAYLRERALDAGPDRTEAAALQQFDALLRRMEADMDSTISALAATLARLDARP